MVYHAKNVPLNIIPIWPTTIDLAGGTVGSSEITGITADVGSDNYRFGWMNVLDGDQAGRMYPIKSNGENSVKVTKGDLLESNNSVTNSDRVALFPMKGVSQDEGEWLLVNSTILPTPSTEWKEVHALRTGNPAYRFGAYKNKRVMETTIEFTVQDGKMFPYIFPKSVDTGTGSLTASTISASVYSGEDEVPLASLGSAVVGHQIRIGSATEGEIREISAVNGSTVTLDQPLRRYHASGASATVMNSSAKFTHIYEMNYGEVYRMWPFILKAIYNESPHSGNLTMYHWLFAKGFTLKNEGNHLKCSIPVIGVNFNYVYGCVEGSHDGAGNASVLSDSDADFLQDGVRPGFTVQNLTDGSEGTITAVTKTTITATLAGGTDNDWDASDSYKIDIYEAPTQLEDNYLLYYNSAISFAGVEDGKVLTTDTTVDYGAEGKYYHNDDEDFYASEIVFKASTQNSQEKVRIENDKFIKLLQDGNEYETVVQYDWNSAGTEYLKIEKTNCAPENIPHPAPEGGPIEDTLKSNPQLIKVTIVDSTPYH